MLKLNRSIANTSRQSYMHMIVSGIRHHQNWGIGPSLGSRERTVEIVKMTEVIVEIWNIIVNILIFIHSWWNLNKYKQLVYISVHGETSYLKRDWHYSEELWESYHLSYCQWLHLNLNTDIHRIHLVELIPRLRLHIIYIIVGEWYRSHICGTSPCLRYTSRTRKRVQSAEKQVWLLLPTTLGLSDYYIVLVGCKK